jgi:hypothetical protein
MPRTEIFPSIIQWLCKETTALFLCKCSLLCVRFHINSVDCTVSCSTISSSNHSSYIYHFLKLVLNIRAFPSIMKLATIFTSATFAAVVIAAPKFYNVISARQELNPTSLTSSSFAGGRLLAGDGLRFSNVAGSK